MCSSDLNNIGTLAIGNAGPFSGITTNSGDVLINVSGGALTVAEAINTIGATPGNSGAGFQSGFVTLTATGNLTVSDTITVDTCDSDFDTLLAVYTGDSLDSLTEVASNDESIICGSESLVRFQSTAGTRYLIAVDGFPGTIVGGTGTIHLFLEPLDW